MTTAIVLPVITTVLPLVGVFAGRALSQVSKSRKERDAALDAEVNRYVNDY